tara:strand:+ start:128 stop:967 length:840 start_codon:yes stop_codon:yes gene_type:complete
MNITQEDINNKLVEIKGNANWLLTRLEDQGVNILVSQGQFVFSYDEENINSEEVLRFSIKYPLEVQVCKVSSSDLWDLKSTYNTFRGLYEAYMKELVFQTNTNVKRAFESKDSSVYRKARGKIKAHSLYHDATRQGPPELEGLPISDKITTLLRPKTPSIKVPDGVEVEVKEKLLIPTIYGYRSRGHEKQLMDEAIKEESRVKLQLPETKGLRMKMDFLDFNLEGVRWLVEYLEGRYEGYWTPELLSNYTGRTVDELLPFTKIIEEEDRTPRGKVYLNE